MGRCNLLPCLRNWFFPKSVHLALGVMDVTDPVPIDLQEFDENDVRILEIRIERQGETDVSPLLIQPMLFHILSSACSHGFLSSVAVLLAGGRSSTNLASMTMQHTCGQ